MADTPVIEQTQVKEIDPATFLRQRNEAEAARRAGKEAPKVEAVATTAVAEPIKRKSGVNRLHREIGELRGRLAAFEEMRKTPEAAKVTELKTEPAREDFATDEEFSRATRAHEIRTEAAKLLDEKDAEKATDTEFKDTLGAISGQLQKAVEEFPDWDAVITEGNKTPLPGNMPEYSPVLFIAMSKSAGAKNPVYNDLVYHFAKNPSELVDLMKKERSANGLPKKQGEKIVAEVIEEFHSLCGELRAAKKTRTASNATAVKVESKVAPTRAELDAKKPAPSSSAEVKGGNSPNLEPPKVGTPEWIRLRNERQYGSGNVGRGR